MLFRHRHLKLAILFLSNIVGLLNLAYEFFWSTLPTLNELNQYYRLFLIWQAIGVFVSSLCLIIFGDFYQEYFGCFSGSVGVLMTVVILYTAFSKPGNSTAEVWIATYLFFAIFFNYMLFLAGSTGPTSIPNTASLSWTTVGFFAFEFLYLPIVYGYHYRESFFQTKRKQSQLVIFLVILSILAITALIYGLLQSSLGNIFVAALNIVLIHWTYVFIFEGKETWPVLLYFYYLLDFSLSTIVMSQTDFPWLQFLLVIALLLLPCCLHDFLSF